MIMSLKNVDLERLLNERGLDRSDSVTVFKGFPVSWISKLPNKILESIPADANIDQVYQVNRDELIPLLTAHNQNEWGWLTYEEFLQINEIGMAVAIFGTKKITIIENNLYRDSFPLITSFDEVQEAYEKLSLQDDQLLDEHQEPLANKVFTFFEQITQIEGRYFVKYAALPDNNALQITTISLWRQEDLADVKVTKDEVVEREDSIGFDLNRGEDEFSAYLADQCNGSVSSSIRAHYIKTFDNVADRKNRLKILALITMDMPVVHITRLLPAQRPVKHLSDYQRILKDRWGFSNFRELSMYQDPESGSSKKYLVSQARIIEDIVEQSEQALSGTVPRDVFITAPTGAGKSVMFQLPALYLLEKHPDIRPLTLIISPLIGLMNDQVEGMMKKGITNAKTINSALAPADKQQTIADVKEGKIDLLYLSPETLQNRSDITQIIGDRRIGLLIVDEAHTVVTWGKSFRADYWYLGLYLQKLRKSNGQMFPIVTFTATATIGGDSDMYRDIRNSLNMINPITYIGDVRRNDIIMRIKMMPNVKGKNSLDLKAYKLLVRMKNWKRNNQKALIYFPTVKLLNSIKQEIDSSSSVGDLTRAYYGSMTPSDKENSYQDFRNGKALFMFATKAFGMGIDIKDIANVYHYAPTGDVVDYVQEIGRVARNHKVVPYGNAYFDYIPSSDFKYVKQLHGMSTIQEWQLTDAMKKILQLYKQNKYNRNLVISAEDFKYVLDLNDDKGGEDQADNKLKIILLMLEKDFSGTGNYNYAPFVARPKQVFGRELVFITEANLADALKSKIGKYLKKVAGLPADNVYSMDMAGYWKKYHQDESYPRFKYEVFNKNERQKHNGLRVFDRLRFASSINVSWTENQGLQSALSSVDQVMNVFHHYLDRYAYTGKQFQTDELAEELVHNVSDIHSKTVAITVVASLVNLCDVITNRTKTQTINRRVQDRSNQFSVAPTYSNFFESVRQVTKELNTESGNRILNEAERLITLYYPRSFGGDSVRATGYDVMLAFAGFLESLGHISFQTTNGSEAQIYVRINNTRRMDVAVKNPKYRNSVLHKIKRDYRRNVAMLEYLFKYEPKGKTDAERNEDYTEFFWDNIESFFLGKLPVDLNYDE